MQVSAVCLCLYHFACHEGNAKMLPPGVSRSAVVVRQLLKLRLSGLGREVFVAGGNNTSLSCDSSSL